MVENKIRTEAERASRNAHQNYNEEQREEYLHSLV